MMTAPVVDVRLSELIAPSFYELHRELKEERYDEYWLKGGRVGSPPLLVLNNPWILRTRCKCSSSGGIELILDRSFE